MPNVYCTWYHSGASNEKKLRANTEFAAAQLQPYGLDVMQIDDKWQSLLPKGFEHGGAGAGAQWTDPGGCASVMGGRLGEALASPTGFEPVLPA